MKRIKSVHKEKFCPGHALTQVSYLQWTQSWVEAAWSGPQAGYQNSSRGSGLNNKKLLRDVPKDRKSSGGMLKRSCERHPRNKKSGEKHLSGMGSLQRRPLLTRNFKSRMWHDVKILPLMLSALKIESPEAKWSLWSGSISINFRMHKGVITAGLVLRCYRAPGDLILLAQVR